MTETWKKRCLIDEEEHPTRRRAWKQGWMYREEHGPGDPHWYAPRSLTGSPDLLSAWIEGFEAADKYFTAPERWS